MDERRLAGRASRGLAAACLVALLASACVSYQPRPISPAGTVADFDSRRLSAPGLREFALERAGIDSWPPASWDLPTLTVAAFYYNPDLDLARASWGVTQAGVKTAGQIPNPALSVAEGYNVTSTGISPWIPEAILDIPIETAGKRGLRIAQARHLSQAARLEVLSAAWAVRSRLRRAMVELAIAGETASLAARQRDLEAETVQVLSAQLAAGQISSNEVTMARIALDHARLAATEADRRRAQARVELAAALGVPVIAVDGVDLTLDSLPSGAAGVTSDEARRAALVGRPDILAALAEYEATQSALQLEIARQWPDISIGAGYQLDQTDVKWTLGLGISLPAMNGNRGPIAEAEARRAEAATRFLALQARVISDLEGALESYRSADATAATAGELLADVKRREETATAAFRLGEISRLELLGVRLEVAAGHRAYLDAKAATVLAAGTLEDAMQSPLAIGSWFLEQPQRSGGDTEPDND